MCGRVIFYSLDREVRLPKESGRTDSAQSFIFLCCKGGNKIICMRCFVCLFYSEESEARLPKELGNFLSEPLASDLCVDTIKNKCGELSVCVFITEKTAHTNSQMTQEGCTCHCW